MMNGFDRRPRGLLSAIFALWLFGVVMATHATNKGDIWVIDIEGAIGPATSDYVLRGFEAAEDAGAAAILLRINTPGGLDGAMRDIISAILASNTPVISWVGPNGSRAASAGTYILYASHIAAMAPATNLGAATPVQIGAPSLPGKPDVTDPTDDTDATDDTGASAMDKKMINDASAYIIGLAELRGRNSTWAEQAVREAASIDATTARELGVIDIVAGNLTELVAAIDGRTVAVADGETELQLKNSAIYTHAPDWRTEILSIITNPSIVLVLGMIGMYGIILEFYNPGAMIPGVVGVICLLLAAYSVQLLPLNYAGLALIVFGLALMVAEAMLPSFGVLGIGGIIAFSIGGIMLFDTDIEAYQVGIPTVAAIATVSAILIIATINMALKVRRRQVVSGENLLLGASAIALSDFEEEGQVRVAGEIWRATSAEPIRKNDTVIVDTIDGLLLRVKKSGEKNDE